jgi:hypothetical protein
MQCIPRHFPLLARSVETSGSRGARIGPRMRVRTNNASVFAYALWRTCLRGAPGPTQEPAIFMRLISSEPVVLAP